MGSSVRISRTESHEELQEALEEASHYDARVIVEQGIEAREIEVTILGNEDVHTTLPGGVVKDVTFYDYDTKYTNNTVEVRIPAHIPKEVAHQAQEYTKKAHIMLDGSGLGRCDFFLTSKNELFLNELSTTPGFTDFNTRPLLWENMDLKYSDLIEKLTRLALNRFKQRQEFYNN